MIFQGLLDLKVQSPIKEGVDTISNVENIDIVSSAANEGWLYNVTHMSAGSASALFFTICFIVWVLMVIFPEARKVFFGAKGVGSAANETEDKSYPEEEIEDKPRPPEIEDKNKDLENLKSSEEEESSNATFGKFWNTIHIDKDLDEAEEILGQLIASGKFSEEVGRTLYYKFAKQAGLSSGTDELKRLERDNKTWVLPSLSLSEHYISCDLLDEAEKHADCALERVQEGDDHEISARIKKARILFLKNQKDDAFKLLQEGIEKYDKEERCGIYIALADLHKENEDPDAESYFLEAALKCDADDKDIRFRLAFLYSEQKEDLAATHHYSVLLKQDRTRNSALNNYAALLAKFGINGKKQSLMKEGAENGEAYPAANLAISYASEGFYQDAKEVLDALPDNLQSDERTLEARNHIQEHQNEEDKKEKILKDSSKKYYKLISEQVDNEIDRDSLYQEKEENFSGAWLLNDDKLELEYLDGKLKGKYETGTKRFKVKSRKLGASIVFDLTQTEFFGPQHTRGFVGLFGISKNTEPSWHPVMLLGQENYKLKCAIKSKDCLEAYREKSNNEIEKVTLTRL